jgi:hypothetical protein
MDRETALRILRELIADYYRRGGREQPEDMSRRAPNFHEWLLRHVVTDMLNRRTQWTAAYSETQIDRVAIHSVQDYTVWTDGDATHVRMHFVARVGTQQSFTLHGALQGTGCGLHIATGRSVGLTIRGAVARDGSVTTAQSVAAPRGPSPARGRGATRQPHH